MRDIKVLLTLVLENMDGFRWGLCDIVRQLYRNNIINVDEYLLLLKYMEVHRPNNSYKRRGIAYFWKSGLSKPRIAWLKRQIKKQSK